MGLLKFRVKKSAAFFFGALTAALILIQAQELPAEEIDPGLPVHIFFDGGNPDNSVGVVGKTVLHHNDLYEENFRVISFDRKAIIFQDQGTGEIFRWSAKGELDPKYWKWGRAFFVVRQMRAIFEAQVAYLNHHGKKYAPTLNTLIREGFLPDGFSEDLKQGYHFKIEKAGESERRSPSFLREPVFMAVALPEEPGTGNWYFSIDQLGLVRYAETTVQLSWAPGWDYMNASPVESEYAGVA